MADGITTATVDASRRETPSLKLKSVEMTVPNGRVANPYSANIMRVRSPVTLRALKYASRLADFVSAVLISYICLRLSGTTFLAASVATALPFILLPIGIVIGLKATEAYTYQYSAPALDHLLRVANGSGLTLTLIIGGIWAVNGLQALHWVFIAALLMWVTVIILHAHFLALIRTFTRSGRFNENVVIVGATENARRLIARNQETQELNIVGVFDDRFSRTPAALSGVPLLGRLDDLMGWEDLPHIDRIIVTVTSDARERVRGLIDRLRILPQRIVLLLDLDGFDPESQSLAEIARSPAAYVSGAPRDERRAVIARLSDVIFASILLIGFSPIMLLTALAIKLESPGPVFFRQRRHGFNNQIIRVWKFRSMHDNKAAEECMRKQTFENDPRVTRIGKFIRRTSIDELPQFLNVLMGDMSIVGPRPHALGMTTEETEVHAIVGEYAHRHRVKPGITGWAQINGSRGPVHTKFEVRERVRFDLEYVNRASFWFDVYIMVMTAPCLLGDTKRAR